jgi:hypothetical protein
VSSTPSPFVSAHHVLLSGWGMRVNISPGFGALFMAERSSGVDGR